MKNIKDKIKHLICLSIIVTFGSLFISCEGDLEPETFDTLSPSSFLQSEADAELLVNGFYTTFNSGWNGKWNNWKGFLMNEFTTDAILNSWGSGNSMRDFTFNPNAVGEVVELYNSYTVGVTKATNVIADLEGVENMDDDRRNELIAEVRAARAFMIFLLYDNYGPPPVVVDPEITQDSNTDFNPVRPTKEWTVEYIESELKDAEQYLMGPSERTVDNFGRITRGMAKTTRLKLYMHEKMWTKADEVSADIVNNEGYELLSNYNDVFSVQSEGNNEAIFVFKRSADPAVGITGNTWITSSIAGDVYANVQGWAGFKMPWDYYDKYEANDSRLDKIISTYTSVSSGDFVDLRANGEIGAFPQKYTVDPNRNGDTHGNDNVVFRYADVLLLRAEALNELTALSPEAIQLVNQVRARSGVDGTTPSFTSQAELREFILEERARELYHEGWRRSDLIRNGTFISSALARGRIFARDYHVLFPIPQSAIDANPLIEQNPGYSGL